jgi:hypothetical protein
MKIIKSSLILAVKNAIKRKKIAGVLICNKVKKTIFAPKGKQGTQDLN